MTQLPLLSQFERRIVDLNGIIYFLLSISSIALLFRDPPQDFLLSSILTLLIWTIPTFFLGYSALSFARAPYSTSISTLVFRIALVINVVAIFIFIPAYQHGKPSDRPYSFIVVGIMICIQFFQAFANNRIICKAVACKMIDTP